MYWVAYFLLCVIAALLGRRSRLGFGGVLMAGVVLTPIAALAYVVLFGPPKEKQ